MVALRWVAGPQRRRRDIVVARALAEAVAAGAPLPPAADVADVAERAARSGARATAETLLTAAERAAPDDPAVRRARRRSVGFVGRVPENILEAAVATDAARRGVAAPTAVRASTVAVGRDPAVEVVARHHLSDGHTMIRKTELGTAPLEVLVFGEVLSAIPGGRWWRAPHVQHLDAEPNTPPRRWHLFLEDLGALRPPTSGPELLAAARAIGELDALLGALTAGDGFEWLAQPVPRGMPLPPARDVARYLHGVVSADVVTPVTDVLDRLHSARPLLLDALCALPVAWSHGDCHPGNLSMDGTCTVVLDWSKSCRAPVGVDLGHLLGLAEPALRRAPDLMATCLDTFRDGVHAAVGTAPTRAELELAFGHRFVTRGLRWQLAALPPPREAAVTARTRAALLRAWHGRRRSTVEANLRRWRNEAERLLAAVAG